MNSVLNLHYKVLFKAAQGKVPDEDLMIEGYAVDSSLNSNGWLIPPESLDMITESLRGSQLRIDHDPSILCIVGKVDDARREGNRVWFRGRVSDPAVKDKILKNYVDSVSIQIDATDTQCSKCGMQTRKNGVMTHLCEDAFEIVKNPKCRELSIVSSPAYKDTKFQIAAGFASAMDESQKSYFSNPKNFQNAKETHQELVKANQERTEKRRAATKPRIKTREELAIENFDRELEYLIASLQTHGLAGSTKVQRLEAIREEIKPSFGELQALQRQVNPMSGYVESKMQGTVKRDNSLGSFEAVKALAAESNPWRGYLQSQANKKQEGEK